MHWIDGEDYIVSGAPEDRIFTDGGPGVDATRVPARWLNAVQGEIGRAIEHASIMLIGTGAADTHDQLISALRRPEYTPEVFNDIGSANTVVITPNPAFVAYTNGYAFVVNIDSDNTGATTLKINSLTAKPVYNLDGTELKAGDLQGNSFAYFQYRSAGDIFYLLNPSNVQRDNIISEVATARGTEATLNNRLNNAMLSDGTLRHYGNSLVDAWGIISGNDGTILNSVNIDSVVKSGTYPGTYTVTLTTAFSGVHYAVVATAHNAGAYHCSVVNSSGSQFEVRVYDDVGGLTNATFMFMVAGDATGY